MRLLERLGSRPHVIAAGWAVAAVLAVLVGVVGINLVGAGLTSQQNAPISEDEVLGELDRLDASAAAPGTASAGPSPSATSGAPVASGTPRNVRSFVTRAGTVIADCERIVSVAPAQGFAVHDQDRDEAEFRNSRDGRDRVEVELRCIDGSPQLEITRDD